MPIMKKPEDFNYTFGPVPSRRLGRSLGVDIIPFKTCTFDCVYCQLGPTSKKVDARASYVSPKEVVQEVLRKLKICATPDYITFAGSGEPTIESGLGEIIAWIKSETDLPVAILTNGSLLWREDVRKACAFADLVIPSLDAGDQETFELINRPCTGVSLQEVVEGVIGFRKMYIGEMWLEVMLLKEINDDESHVRKIAEIARRIEPERVQLNTVVRPPAETTAQAVAVKRLNEYCSLFNVPTEVIAPPASTEGMFSTECGENDIIDMLRRRPCTLGDISEGLNVHRNEIVKYIEILKAKGAVATSERAGKTFYMPVEQGQEF